LYLFRVVVDQLALVVFDPLKIKDNASFVEPRRSPDGIHAVFVNGTLTVDGSRHTGVMAGGVVRP